MIRPPVQWGMDLEKGALNGTFLVLNLGTNTVGLGSSCGFQSFPPITIQSTLNPIAVQSFSQKEAGSITTASNSTEGGQTVIPGKHKHNGVSEKEEDRDWVPEKKVGKRSSSTCKKATTKPSHLMVNRSEATPSFGRGSGMFVSKDATPEPSQLRQKNPYEGSVEGGNGTVLSGSEPPPQYLMKLLNFFGWKVVFRCRFRDWVYISPQGVSYLSLPKAFETFLHDTSKYKEKEWGSSRSMDGGDLNGNSVHGAPVLNCKMETASVEVVKDSTKRKRGRKKRIGSIAEPVEPNISSEEPILVMQETAKRDGEGSSLMREEMASEEVNRVALSPSENGQDAGSNTHPDIELPVVRRSTRLRGRHILIESEADSETEADDSCLYPSEYEESGETKDDEEEPTPSTSDAENMFDEKSEACMEDRFPETRKSDCSIVTVEKNNQISNNGIHQNNKFLEVRRSSHINMEHASLDVEVNMERGPESNFLDSSKFLVNKELKKEKGLLMISASQVGDVVNEKIESCNKGEYSSSGTDQFHSNSMTPVNNAQTGGTGIRRSMRINGKHVPVDDEMVMDVVTDACSFDLSIYAVNGVTPKYKVDPITSAFEIEKMEGGMLVPDDTLSKDVTANNIECHMPKTQKELEINWLKKSDRSINPISEKYSSSVLENGMEILVPGKCSPSSASKRKAAGGGNSNGKKKKKRSGGCGLMVRRNAKDVHHKEISQNKVSILSWLIDAGTLTENEKLVHKVKNDRGNLLRGLATRAGIRCNCCKKIMSLFEFEAHAGSNLCQPWYNICLVSGKSLMQCQMEAWEKEKKRRKVGFQTVGVDDPDPSDDTCGVCADGGHLICCDSCPSTFHKNCIMLEALPEGRWDCPYCRCAFCRVAKRGSDSVNEALSLFACHQCGCKYHWECARESNMHEIGAESLLFCRKNCKEVDAGLSGLLGIANQIGEGFSWTLLKRLDEDEEISSNQRLCFIMECNAKLSMALSVLNECFVPLVDPGTGLDMLSHAVYNCGSNFKRLNYAGFYTVILEKDEEIISVASLRLHGTYLAEMPFIGTRPLYRRQGMCRRLLMAIEDMLSSLHVEKLVIPAIPELLETWMTSFAFKPLELSHKDEIRNMSMMVFLETSLLQKSIYKTGTKYDGEDGQADINANLKKEMHMAHNSQSCGSCWINSESSVAGGLNVSLGLNSEHGIEGWEDTTTLESCGKITGNSPAAYAFGGHHSENSYGSVPDTLPVQSVPMPNQGGVPTRVSEQEIYPFHQLMGFKIM